MKTYKRTLVRKPKTVARPNIDPRQTEEQFLDELYKSIGKPQSPTFTATTPAAVKAQPQRA